MESDKEVSELEWDEFFEKIIIEIEKNTKNVSELKSDFSTSDSVAKILSTMAIMDSMKQYFEYGRTVPCCGIQQVHFLGNLNDWLHLSKKIENLKKYAIKKSWTVYIDGLAIIINNFIETFKNNVDVNWWNQILNLKNGRLGSGSTKYISGWILNFYYGYTNSQEPIDVGDLTNPHLNVPVKVTNHLTK